MMTLLLGDIIMSHVLCAYALSPGKALQLPRQCEGRTWQPLAGLQTIEVSSPGVNGHLGRLSTDLSQFHLLLF